MYCANCCYLDYNSHECGRYYCTRKYDYHYADEKSCTYFCDSKYSSDLDTKYRTKDQMNMAIQNSMHSRNEGCYITTIIVHTLGLGDKHKTITTIRNFRNNYLQKNIIYKKLLLEYDLLGPTIADSIEKDNNKIKLSKNIYNNYLIKIENDITNKNYEKAIVKYLNMTEILRLYYGINNVDITNENTSDITSLGHGKPKIRSLNKD